MTRSDELVVHVVDDDATVRRSLERLLLSAGFRPVLYDSAAAVLANLAGLSPGCILLDVCMPQMGGLELQARLNDLGSDLPTVMITGQADVLMAVRAMKAGALHLIEKPFDDERLFAAVNAAFAATGQVDRDRQALDAARRIGMLSRRERQVLDGLMAGRQNKLIAFELGISVRTVEVHRFHMLERLETRRLAEAIRLAVLATFVVPARSPRG